MADWNNDDLTLYHGCTDESLQPTLRSGIAIGALPTGIDLSACSRRAEFGQGFYATTWFDQAKFWANHRVKKLRSRSRPIAAKAIVLRFDVHRDHLAGLDALVFTNEKGSFWPFVRYCRAGNPPHRRMTASSTRYDIVYGPVSLWAAEMIIKDADQVSFHTPQALKIIPALQIVATGNPEIM
jgi:hypothetical protein